MFHNGFSNLYATGNICNFTCLKFENIVLGLVQ